jgi:hypothetical protein
MLICILRLNCMTLDTHCHTCSAIEFLDVLRSVDWQQHGFIAPPMIHCYCFSKADDPAQDAIHRANAVMGTALPRDAVQVHFVRDVAPKKPMMCLSFRAPAAAAAASTSSDVVAAAAVAAAGEQPAAKRQKTDSATASTTGE